MVRHTGLSTLLIAALMLPEMAASGEGGVISERLAAALPGLRAGESIPIIVSLNNRADPFAIRTHSSTTGGMIRALRDSVGARFGAVRGRIGRSWPDVRVRLFWINQTIALEATRPLIEALALDPGIGMIDSDEKIYFEEDSRVQPAESSALSVLPWNISITGVDSVWDAYGLDGAGVLIGTLDTGIDTAHPALHGKLREGVSWKDFIFSATVPYDNFGHGTFGSGILVGGDGGISPVPGIGIAHGARLVVGKILDAGASSISTVTSGMQWMLDPDGDPSSDDYPRVVNNSWFSGTRGSTYAYAAAEAWRAAGIVPVFCAGNSGPASGSTRSPGDYKNCLSIGGTNASDERYAGTSVGPSPADSNYFPADGRKPDFSAPGEGVYSSAAGGGYGYSSGTSWSAPHVTGIVALMLQANPTLDYDRIYAILKGSARDLGDAGYDYVFGYGRVSAMDAVRGALRERIGVRSDPVLRTTETGGSAFFDVALALEPVDPVCITISPTDTTEAAVSPAYICFTQDDWDVPQRVYVTGVDDDAPDGSIGYSVRMITSSADPLYDGIEPAPISAVNADDEGTVVVTMARGWNLVSVPTVAPDPRRESVFPASSPPAYAYASGYLPEDTLRAGVGYWLRFEAPGSVHLLGERTLVETVSVSPGWNLIGSASLPVPVSGIAGEPPGLAVSHFYGYSGGYAAADTIRPGAGYWVKAAGAGVLILRADTSAPGPAAIPVRRPRRARTP